MIAGELVTVSVTEIVWLFCAPGDEIRIDPVYVPTSSPAPFTETLSVEGVVAFCGLTDSQFCPPPWFTVAVAWKVIAAPVPVTLTVCGAGGWPVVFCVKVRELVDTPSVAVGVTVRVTGTVSGIVDVALATFAGLVATIVTVPVYVPTPKPAGFAVTVMFEGVGPVAVLIR